MIFDDLVEAVQVLARFPQHGSDKGALILGGSGSKRQRAAGDNDQEDIIKESFHIMALRVLFSAR